MSETPLIDLLPSLYRDLVETTRVLGEIADDETCDHDANVCFCGWKRVVADARETLAKVRAIVTTKGADLVAVADDETLAAAKRDATELAGRTHAARMLGGAEPSLRVTLGDGGLVDVSVQ